jgi:hypothetical protein
MDRLIVVINMNLLVTMMLALFGTSVAAFAQGDHTPTDKDLQANYCLAVKKAQYAWWKSTRTPIPKDLENSDQIRKMQDDASAKMQGDIQRLKVYVASRIKNLDPFPMQTAYNQGESDFKYLMDNEDSIMKSIDECVSKKCNGVPKNQLPTCLIENNKGCADELNFEQSKRIEKCNDLSFLPL